MRSKTPKPKPGERKVAYERSENKWDGISSQIELQEKLKIREKPGEEKKQEEEGGAKLTQGRRRRWPSRRRRRTSRPPRRAGAARPPPPSRRRRKRTLAPPRAAACSPFLSLLSGLPGTGTGRASKLAKMGGGALL